MFCTGRTHIYVLQRMQRVDASIWGWVLLPRQNQCSCITVPLVFPSPNSPPCHIYPLLNPETDDKYSTHRHRTQHENLLTYNFNLVQPLTPQALCTIPYRMYLSLYVGPGFQLRIKISNFVSAIQGPQLQLRCSDSGHQPKLHYFTSSAGPLLRSATSKLSFFSFGSGNSA